VTLLLLLALAAAQPAAPANEPGLAFVTLENGLRVGFALVRTAEVPQPIPSGETLLARSNGVSRVLVDRETGAFFGYRLVAERMADKEVRVAFQPLPEGVEAELRSRMACAGCPAPVRLASAEPRLPDPQRIADGESLSLELLANPQTSERILDVLTVSSSPVTPEALRSAAERTLAAWRAGLRAAVFVARREHAAAVEEYKKALALLPNDASLHNKLGVVYQGLGKDELARREYERAVALNPRHASAWNNLGTLEHAQRRFKQAIRAYRKATELRPQLASPWMNMGAAQLALGRVEEGLAAYRQAFELDPAVLESRSGTVVSGVDAADQYYYIAKMLAAAGRLEPALQFLLKASASGFREWDKVRGDAAFAPLKDDPRYQQLLRDAGSS
jgi:tetratricopeptide (TPR) repeat protein